MKALDYIKYRYQGF